MNFLNLDKKKQEQLLWMQQLGIPAFMQQNVPGYGVNLDQTNPKAMPAGYGVLQPGLLTDAGMTGMAAGGGMDFMSMLPGLLSGASGMMGKQEQTPQHQPTMQTRAPQPVNNGLLPTMYTPTELKRRRRREEK